MQPECLLTRRCKGMPIITEPAPLNDACPVPLVSERNPGMRDQTIHTVLNEQKERQTGQEAYQFLTLLMDTGADAGMLPAFPVSMFFLALWIPLKRQMIKYIFSQGTDMIQVLSLGHASMEGLDEMQALQFSKIPIYRRPFFSGSQGKDKILCSLKRVPFKPM